jgi:hypothetical protein
MGFVIIWFRKFFYSTILGFRSSLYSRDLKTGQILYSNGIKQYNHSVFEQVLAGLNKAQNNHSETNHSNTGG